MCYVFGMDVLSYSEDLYFQYSNLSQYNHFKILTNDLRKLLSLSIGFEGT